MPLWNPWHGCHKLSAGCRHCYVYRIDEKHGRDSSVVTKTRNFDFPVRRTRTGTYKIPAGSTVFTCFSSDFFVEEADPWRPEAWEMIRERSDLHFFMITKRIDRLEANLPPDWEAGYPHVTICCTVENQERADYRLPIYRDAPIRHKIIICEPLLGPIDLSPWPGRGSNNWSPEANRASKRVPVLSNGCSICAGNVSNAAYRSVSGKPEPGCSKTERSTASAANSSTHKPANRASTTNNPPFVRVGKHIA